MEQGGDATHSFWRSRAGWITAHILGGIAAAVIGFGLIFAISIAVYGIPSLRPLALMIALITLAALAAFAPLIGYQSWALRQAVVPSAWWLACAAAILSKPSIVAASDPLIGMVARPDMLPQNAIDALIWAAASVIAGLWAASMQWLALRGGVGLARWIARGGLGFTLVALAAGSQIVTEAADLLIVWMFTLPVALALYGALTWPVLQPLITQHPSPASP